MPSATEPPREVARPGAVSSALGAFVGRDADLAAIGALFDRGERLVTVAGPGGVGKTRLARELVVRRGAATFCDLTEARAADEVCAAVAGALGGALGGDDDPVAQVGRALDAAPAVLVLDNCEQGVDAVAACVARWLALAPRAQVLATSREVLRLEREVVYHLAPLEVPDAGAAEPRGAALAMLLDRARRVRRDYAAEGDEAAAAGELLRRLEGLPLAIELAAPRVAALGARGVLARLGHGLDALARQTRDAAGRQATLRASLDASWAPLAPLEQRVLAACAVFRGGFDLAALDALVDESGAAADALESLHRKSLVRLAQPAAGPPRYDLYLAIREYAAERLSDSGARVAVEDRHAAHYAAAGRALFEQASGPHAAAALAALAAERHNLGAVVERGVAPGATAARVGQALEAVIALGAVARSHGPAAHYVALLDRVIAAAAGAAVGGRALAEARLWRGVLRRSIGRSDASLEDLRAAVAQAAAAGDRQLEAQARYRLGGALASVGELDAARDAAERVESLAAALDDRALRGRAALLRAWIGRGTADARGHLERALALAQLAHDAQTENTARVLLAAELLDQGLAREAGPHAERAEVLALAQGNHRGRALAVQTHAHVAHDTGALAAAAALYARAIELFARLGCAVEAAENRAYLGLVRAEQGAWDEASALLLEATDTLRALGWTRLDRRFRAALAFVDACAGRHAPAAAALREARDDDGADAPALQALRAATTKVLADGGLPAAPSEPRALPAMSLERRLALRVVVARLGGRWTADALAAARAPATRAAALLRADRSGAWFAWEPGAGPRVALRGAMRKVFAELLRTRLASPGALVDARDLIGAGWPGERIQPHAARTRLHTTVYRLRRLGLGPALVAEGEGYYLDPAVDLVTD